MAEDSSVREKNLEFQISIELLETVHNLHYIRWSRYSLNQAAEIR